jgi:hypothetical protein
MPVIIEIRVVFPAPLGPNSPNISPFFTQNDKFLTATCSGLPPTDLYIFLKSLIIKGKFFSSSSFIAYIAFRSFFASSSSYSASTT